MRKIPTQPELPLIETLPRREETLDDFGQDTDYVYHSEQDIDDSIESLADPVIKRRVTIAGEGVPSNSHSHGDTSNDAQTPTPFQEWRKAHNLKIKEFNNANSTECKTRFIGSATIEEASLVYSDSCGIKHTNWFSVNQLSFRCRSLSRLGSTLNYVRRRDLICDLFLTPHNIIEQEVIEVISL